MGKAKVFLKESEHVSKVRVNTSINTSQTEMFIKRFLDTIASLAGLIILAPLYAIIYIAIKWEDGGKVIFRQERVGYKGRIFTLYKFRSMKEKAEENGKPELCQENDCRLTRVSRQSFS